ncbi:hypothetical protein LI328DRAFT_94692 [Trichoderma asperelloides]|nr:hypothetical protein LI328DRAFT_94692 [Trichoderma asperelloides]
MFCLPQLREPSGPGKRKFYAMVCLSVSFCANRHLKRLVKDATLVAAHSLNILGRHLVQFTHDITQNLLWAVDRLLVGSGKRIPRSPVMTVFVSCNRPIK